MNATKETIDLKEDLQQSNNQTKDINNLKELLQQTNTFMIMIVSFGVGALLLVATVDGIVCSISDILRPLGFGPGAQLRDLVVIYLIVYIVISVVQLTLKSPLALARIASDWLLRRPSMYSKLGVS